MQQEKEPIVEYGGSQSDRRAIESGFPESILAMTKCATHLISHCIGEVDYSSMILFATISFKRNIVVLRAKMLWRNPFHSNT